jgi:hypothetical protein
MYSRNVKIVDLIREYLQTKKLKWKEMVEMESKKEKGEERRGEEGG